jgi:hypothetical protein
LGADDDVVAVEDAGVDHRLAADAQHEQVAVSGEVLRDREQLLDVLGGEDARTRGDVAQQRNVTCRPPFDGRAGGRLERDLDRARLARIALEVPLVLERREVGVDGRRRRQADCFSDLANARRIAAPAHLDVDELQNLALTLGERGGVGSRTPA